jgi:hypothetical protein
MAIAGTKKKGTGGLVTSPPEPMHKALRRLEKQYADKCNELERAQKEITILKDKLSRCRTK